MTTTEQRKPRAPRGSQLAKRSWPAGTEAKRRAAAVLEVLAGLRTPTEAATALGVSLPGYYLLEQRAVAGLAAACEAAGRGPKPNGQRQLAALERQVVQLARERDRYQAVARMGQRSLGLTAPAAPSPGKASKQGPEGDPKGSRRKRRRPTVRALRLAAALRQTDSSSPAEGAAVKPPSASS